MGMNLFYFYLFTDLDSFDHTMISKSELMKHVNKRRSTFTVESEGRDFMNIMRGSLWFNMDNLKIEFFK
jgi:hypothetical protein